MAKRGAGGKKAKAKTPAPEPMTYKPPTPEQRIEMMADDAAHESVRNHPMYKQMHAKAKSGIHKAMKQGPGGLRNVRSA